MRLLGIVCEGNLSHCGCPVQCDFGFFKFHFCWFRQNFVVGYVVPYDLELAFYSLFYRFCLVVDLVDLSCFFRKGEQFWN